MLVRFLVVTGLLLVLSLAADRLMGSAKSSGRVGREMAVAVQELAAGRETPEFEPLPPGQLADAPTQSNRRELESAVQTLQSWQGNSLSLGELDPPRGELDPRDAAQQLLAAAEQMEAEAQDPFTPVWIEGRVVDAEDKQALAGVRIERAGNLLGVTDEDGRFAIESAPESILPVVLNAPEHALVYSYLPTPVEHDAPSEAGSADRVAELQTPAPQLSFELARSAVLEGVLLGTDNAPVAGARLVVSARAEDLHYDLEREDGEQQVSANFHAPDPRWEGWADDEGRLRVDNLPPGVPLALSFWEPEADPHTSDSPVPGGEEGTGLALGCLLAPDRPVVLRPEEKRRVEWRVRPAHGEMPLASAEDVDGSALRMADVVPQPSTSNLSSSGFRPPTSGATATLPVNFSSGTSSVPGAVNVPKVQPSLAGRVVDERGDPLTGMMVIGRREGEVGVRSAVSDSEGRFVLLDLRAGAWGLQVLGESHHPRNRFGPFDVAAVDGAPAVEGGADELELVLRQGVSLTGRVLDQEGQEVAARVEILACGGRASRVQNLKTTSTGMFSTDDLEARSYDLVASDGRGGIATVFDLELQPASTMEVPDLQLRPGGTLRLLVREGPLVQRAVLLYEGHAIRSADMRKRVPLELLMPAGPVEIQLYHGAQRISERSVTVQAEEVLPVDL